MNFSDVINDAASFVRTFLDNYDKAPQTDSENGHPALHSSSDLLTWVPSEAQTREAVDQFLSDTKENEGWISNAIEKDPALKNKPLDRAIIALKKQLQSDNLAVYDRIAAAVSAEKPQAISAEDSHQFNLAITLGNNIKMQEKQTQCTQLLTKFSDDPSQQNKQSVLNLLYPLKSKLYGKSKDSEAFDQINDAIKTLESASDQYTWKSQGLSHDDYGSNNRVIQNILTQSDFEAIQDAINAGIDLLDAQRNLEFVNDMERYRQNPTQLTQRNLFEALPSLKAALSYDKQIDEIEQTIKHESLSGKHKKSLKEAVENDTDLTDTAKANIIEAVDEYPQITQTVANDIIGELLTYQALHAVAWHKQAHALYKEGNTTEARKISQAVRRLTAGIEIHPGAAIGKNFFIDHGSGVVIGETAKIGDNVTLYHRVTLGNRTSKPPGTRRHPQIGDNTTIYTGAELLGSITVGKNVTIGAGTKIIGDDIIIGDGASIGPNLTITTSVPPKANIISNDRYGKPDNDEHDLMKKARKEEVADAPGSQSWVGRGTWLPPSPPSTEPSI